MELKDLKPAEGSKRNRKRVGRGPASGNGKTAGRGMKMARSLVLVAAKVPASKVVRLLLHVVFRNFPVSATSIALNMFR